MGCWWREVCSRRWTQSHVGKLDDDPHLDQPRKKLLQDLAGEPNNRAEHDEGGDGGDYSLEKKDHHMQERNIELLDHRGIGVLFNIAIGPVVRFDMRT